MGVTENENVRSIKNKEKYMKEHWQKFYFKNFPGREGGERDRIYSQFKNKLFVRNAVKQHTQQTSQI